MKKKTVTAILAAALAAGGMGLFKAAQHLPAVLPMPRVCLRPDGPPVPCP